MSRDWRLFLGDIRTAAERILEYTKGMTRDDFFADQRTVDAVVRNLEIIGEAAGHIPQEVRDQAADTSFSRMRGMRNVLAHAYFGIDQDILWDVVQVHVPQVLASIRRLEKSAS